MSLASRINDLATRIAQEFNAVRSEMGGSVDPLELTFTDPAAPPVDTIRLFRRAIAGRHLSAFIGPSGAACALQPFLGRGKVGFWNPPGNGTSVPGLFGLNAFTTTGFNPTSRNVDAGGASGRARRMGYVTAATAGAVGQFRQSAVQFTTGAGNGLGGFFYLKRFVIADSNPVSDARMFIGMRASSSAPTNVEPSTLVNCIGVGHGAADANLKLFYGGSAAQAPIDLGANLSKSAPSYIELALFAPSTESGLIYWQASRIISPSVVHVQQGQISGDATILPQSGTLLAPWGYRTNNASAIAVELDVVSFYIETDY